MEGTTAVSVAPSHPPAPRLKQKAFGKLRSMPLDSSDAYVLSWIDGVTLAHEIVDACGLDTKTVSDALNRMTALGLIEWQVGPKSGDSEVASGSPEERASGTRVATKRNMEAVRAPTPELLERFDRVTHYQLLGLYSDQGGHEIERGYERARNLEFGTLAARYAAKLGEERVLSRVITAYEVLVSPKAKREYDQYLLCREETCAIEDALSEGVRRASLVPPPDRTSAPVSTAPNRDFLAEALKAPRHPTEEKISEHDLVAAIRKQASRGPRRSRAEGLVRSAIEEREAGNLVGATNALRLAGSIVSGCEALQGALATVTRDMHEGLAPTFRAQAVYEENLCMWEAAAKTWEKVLLGRPDDAQAARGVAEALLAAGGNLKRARRRAEEAVRNAPDDAECHRTLGRVYMAAGMAKSAQRSLNMADGLQSQEEDPRGLFSRVRARWSRA
jgi:tetratricopeptide (TPR) repeat protein